ncbi:MAG: glycoside hydrolase family 16 protein [Pseudomonadota bacterium]
MKKRSVAGLAAAAAAVALTALAAPVSGEGPQAGPDLSDYVMTFSADFDKEPPPPNATFLTYYTSWGGLRTLAANGERQIYVDRGYEVDGRPVDVDPFSIEDGVLSITAEPSDDIVEQLTGHAYTSGLITTEGSFAQQFGYFEMRARFPAGRGLWPAFWLVADTQREHLEIDVVEVLGHQPRRTYHSASANRRPGGVHDYAMGVDTSAGMHVYGAEWSPEEIVYYVDGRETLRARNFHDVPMYLIANLAVGGEWPGDPDRSTRFPAVMQIDYIRAYQKRDRLLARGD